jgi:hypothetical protein
VVSTRRHCCSVCVLVWCSLARQPPLLLPVATAPGINPAHRCLWGAALQQGVLLVLVLLLLVLVLVVLNSPARRL